ncbi:hypothetical protein B0H19DRAFT_9888 [Mycena capillaripes]|nr:hypothetical protein B0H19DRAFT_9888 [Mycena capillaripes]
MESRTSAAITDVPAIQDAPAPFSGQHDPEDSADAPDFIVRSGDGVDLHVHKAILKFVSIFFRNMLDGAGSATDLHRDGKPVVVLPEPCDVLHRLLCLAYPGSAEHYSLTAQNLDGIWAVHEAGDKYVFKGVLEMLERMLANPVLIEAHPHRIFAIARLRDLPDLARKAALATLKFPVCPPDLAFPELEHLLAATFQRLHEFHHACGKAAEDIVKANSRGQDFTSPSTYITHAEGTELVWWAYRTDDYHTGKCGPNVTVGYQGDWIEFTPAQWFVDHVDILAAKLRVLPIPQTVETHGCTLTEAHRAMLKSCDACAEHAEHQLLLWMDQLRSRIKDSNTELGECLDVPGRSHASANFVASKL